MGSSSQDSFKAGKFQGFLNLLLCASSAQLRLDIVDQMWVQLRMGSWVFTLFWGGYSLAYLVVPNTEEQGNIFHSKEHK